MSLAFQNFSLSLRGPSGTDDDRYSRCADPMATARLHCYLVSCRRAPAAGCRACASDDQPCAHARFGACAAVDRALQCSRRSALGGRRQQGRVPRGGVEAGIQAASRDVTGVGLLTYLAPTRSAKSRRASSACRLAFSERGRTTKLGGLPAPRVPGSAAFRRHRRAGRSYRQRGMRRWTGRGPSPRPPVDRVSSRRRRRPRLGPSTGSLGMISLPVTPCACMPSAEVRHAPETKVTCRFRFAARGQRAPRR